MKRERLTVIEKEVARVLSSALLTEVKNPKIKGIVSITDVRVTEDLKFADVFVSILTATGEQQTEENRKSALNGLEEVKGFLRKKLADDMELRHTPEIRIKLDDSMEYAAKMNELLDKLKG